MGLRWLRAGIGRVPFTARAMSLGIVVLAATATFVVALSSALNPHLAVRIDEVAGSFEQGAGSLRLESEEVPPGWEAQVDAQEPAEAPDFRLVVPGLSVAAADPEPLPIPEDFLALQEVLAADIAAHGGPTEIAIAVTDIQSGHTIAVNGDRQMLAGCLVNLFVIVEAVRMVQDGSLELEDVDSWIYATTWSSNASTAQVLFSIVGNGDTLEGVRRVRALLDAFGLTPAIVLDHPPAFPASSVGVDANNWVTAAAMNRALVDLYQDRMLDAARTAYVLDALATVKPGLNYLTAAGVPADVVVSHKNGFLPATTGFVDNDAGIVRFERNGSEVAYAVTFLSQNNPVKYSQLPMAQTMMSRIWTYFDAAYPAVH